MIYPRLPQKVLTLSQKVDECKPLLHAIAVAASRADIDQIPVAAHVLHAELAPVQHQASAVLLQRPHPGEHVGDAAPLALLRARPGIIRLFAHSGVPPPSHHRGDLAITDVNDTEHYLRARPCIIHVVWSCHRTRCHSTWPLHQREGLYDKVRQTT